jgi:hypothetical protein
VGNYHVIVREREGAVILHHVRHYSKRRAIGMANHLYRCFDGSKLVEVFKRGSDRALYVPHGFTE